MGKRQSGYTLIELVLVIALLGIISVIAVPRFMESKATAEEAVCNTNRESVDRMFDVFLQQNENEESMFTQFLLENFNQVCPSGGIISHDTGEIDCSVHHSGSLSDGDEPIEEVPWL